MIDLTLRQLQIFEKIATLGNVTRASEALHLTQSAASMALAQAELQCGEPLFERAGKRLVLNDRGRLLLEGAREVLSCMTRVTQDFAAKGNDLVGELHVGASTTIANYLLPSQFGSFIKRHPRTRLELKVGNTQDVVNHVERGEVDFAFVEGPAHSATLHAQKWRHDELVVVVGKEHPWKLHKKVSSKQLSEGAWIVRESGSGTREVFESAMARARVKYSIAMELGHTEAIKNGVAAGLGIGCLSRLTVDRDLRSGWLTEVSTPLKLGRQLWFLRRSQSRPTSLASAFLDMMKVDWR